MINQTDHDIINAKCVYCGKPATTLIIQTVPLISVISILLKVVLVCDNHRLKHTNGL